MLGFASEPLGLLTRLLAVSSGFLQDRLFSSPKFGGDVVKFEIHVTQGRANPTGAGFRNVILVNGSFTGPTLHVKQGDHVEFLVRNYMRESTTVHFHGISQKESPWADGVPGITQKPIRPGSSYVYKWKADDSGVYFYHAHTRGQIMDGMYGSIIIDAPPSTERPFHIISRDPADWAPMREAEKKMQPLLISDWTQYDFKRFDALQHEGNIDYTCMDAIIVNGVGSQYCPSREDLDAWTHPLVKTILQFTDEKGITDKGCVPPLQLFQGNFSIHPEDLPAEAYRRCVPGVGGNANYSVPVHSGDKWAALTFTNPGGLYPLKVTIDNHPLHVYAIDGNYIYPQTVDQILVNNGERYQVLIKLDQRVGHYPIRIANDLLGQVLGGFAKLTYNDATNPPPEPRPLMNYAGQQLPGVPTIRRFSDLDARPYPPLQRIPTHPDQTFKFLVKKIGQPYGAYEWTLDGQTKYHTPTEDTLPILFRDQGHNASGILNQTVLTSKTGEWIDLIIEAEGPFAQAHPMHKHGSKAFIIGRGLGPFPWKNVEEAAKELPWSFNTIDPPLRDSFQSLEAVNNNSWLVLRYKVDNPGAWLFHCHIQTHLTGGMGIVLLDGVDKWPEVPEHYKEWNGFKEREEGVENEF